MSPKAQVDTKRPSAPPMMLPLIEQWKRVLADFPEIAAAYLFGSFARGDQRPDSDIDLGLVLRDPRLTAADLLDPLCDLASRLQADRLDRLFDVVLLDHQGPLLRHQALLEGICVHEADRARRVDFETDAVVRALDFAPTYERATRGRLAAIRRRLGGHRDGPARH